MVEWWNIPPKLTIPFHAIWHPLWVDLDSASCVDDPDVFFFVFFFVLFLSFFVSWVIPSISEFGNSDQTDVDQIETAHTSCGVNSSRKSNPIKTLPTHTLASGVSSPLLLFHPLCTCHTLLQYAKHNQQRKRAVTNLLSEFPLWIPWSAAERKKHFGLLKIASK